MKNFFLKEIMGIPAEIFLQKTGEGFPKGIPHIEWHLFPLKEMLKRRWIHPIKNLKDSAEEAMRFFINDCCPNGKTIETCFKENSGSRINVKTDSYALNSWCMRIMALAQKNTPQRKFDHTKFTPDSLREIAKLSFFDEGPLFAREFLEKHRIHLIIERHLPKTYLDGAALLLEDSTPIVGLTLRYDRIDSFWFCLLHELAHIVLHLGKENQILFVDDMDFRVFGRGKQNDIENEADFLATESLIPNEAWSTSTAKLKPTKKNVLELAEHLKIHPACIAGRVRFEQNNFKLLSRLVGSGKIRNLFEI